MKKTSSQKLDQVLLEKEQFREESQTSESNQNLNLPITLRQSKILLILKLLIWTVVGLFLFSYSATNPLFSTGPIDPAVNYRLWQQVWSFLLLTIVIIGDLYQLVWWYNNVYQIASEQLTHFQGFFWQKRRTVRFPSLDLIRLKQSLFGKIFNYGTITLKSSETQEQIQLRGVPSPQHYVELLKQILPGAEQF